MPSDFLQILRFLVVGTINTFFSYAIYSILIFAGLHYTAANLIALILGICFSFKTQGKFVFKNVDNRLFWRFTLGWSLIYVLSTILISLFMKMGFNAYIAGIMALPFTTICSYFVQKYFVFNKRKES